MSERIQRRIDRLLDEAEQALDAGDWAKAESLARHVLDLDAGNSDALTFADVAQRRLTEQAGSSPLPGGEGRAAPVGAGLRPALPGGHEPDAALDGAGEATAAPSDLSPGPFPSREGETVVPTSFANGRYLVKRFLGEGGKKRVYLAHDTTLDRDVAFALIKTEGLDDTARERISREAQAMGRLGTHPHIVTVFDLGTEAVSGRQWPVGDGDPLSLAHPSPLPLGEGKGEGVGEGETQASEQPRGLGTGQPYMVTELMGGGDVEALIEQARNDPAVGARHAVPLPLALAIAEQVCQGLEFAHAKGIVHRDLKPGNVWLTESLQPSAVSGQELPSPHRGGAGGEVTAKIGDFGLAVAIDRTRLTQAGMMVGTVSYMPPEQATGGEVTPRSDLYSLGAMLYELVTPAGRRSSATRRWPSSASTSTPHRWPPPGTVPTARPAWKR